MDAAFLLRRGLVALVGLGLSGTLVELSILRHWTNPQEFVPWVVLILAGVITGFLAFRPSPRVVRTARIAWLVLAAAGVYGACIHIAANMNAAVLDGTVGPTWDALPLWRQLWMASTGGVGPPPALAGGAMAPTGLALALATLAHPDA
jgi:hypothetical protein